MEQVGRKRITSVPDASLSQSVCDGRASGFVLPSSVVFRTDVRSRLRNWTISQRTVVKVLQALDPAVVVAVGALSWLVASDGNPEGLPSAMWASAIVLIVVLTALCLFGAFGLYASGVALRGPREAAIVSIAWCLAIGPVALFSMTESPVNSSLQIWLLGWSGGGIFALAISRLMLAVAVQPLHRSGRIGDPVCVIGDGAGAAAVAEKIRSKPSGMILVDQVKPLSGSGRGYILPTVEPNQVDELLQFLRNRSIDTVILAMPLDQYSNILATVQQLKQLPIRILLCPFEADMPMAGRNDVRAGLTPATLITVADLPLDGWRWTLKDMQDRLIAVVLLLLLLPLLALTAVAIRFSDAGPVFFKQKRYGYGGKPFEILKFRTMTNSASVASEQKLKLTTRNDDRVFPVGRFLRRTSIDELPQLFNVIRGDMWIIGPRPHSPFATVEGKLYAEAVGDYPSRYRVKPGMTGWAQVNGWRGPTETLDQIANRVACDLFYIDNWSVGLDARILVKTISCVFNSDAAF